MTARATWECRATEEERAKRIVPTVTITIHDGPPPLKLPPMPPPEPYRPAKGDVRYLLAREWELAKVVHDGEVWRSEGIVASATCFEALVAANILLTDQAEMGLPTAWQPEGRTFLTYTEDGRPILDAVDDDDAEDVP